MCRKKCVCICEELESTQLGSYNKIMLLMLHRLLFCEHTPRYYIVIMNIVSEMTKVPSAIKCY